MAINMIINGIRTILDTRTVLIMSVFAILALTFSVVSVPFAFADEGTSTLGPLIKAKKYKLSPNYHVSQSKVCGVSLCGHSNTPESVSVDIQQLGYNDPKKQASFDKAIENPVVLSILREYYAYKQIGYTTTVQVETPSVDVTLSRPVDNPFANPDYESIKTIVPDVQIQDESIPYVVVIPKWIKSSYANPDFPVAKERIPTHINVVDEPILEGPLPDESIVNGTSVELTEEISVIVTNSTE